MTAPSTARRNAIAQHNAVPRNFRGRNGSPTVAFGGSTNNNAALNARAAQNNTVVNHNRSRTMSTRDARSIGVPDRTWRDWDHSRTHEWHNHHFRWYNGDWIIIDPGVPYDYGYYGDDYGDAVPYSDYTIALPIPGRSS
jgi:hypothetical protein